MYCNMFSIILVGLVKLNFRSELLKVWCLFFFYKVVKVECMDIKFVSVGFKDIFDFCEN